MTDSTKRTPWKAEKSPGHYDLWIVRDSDGALLTRRVRQEVAQLIETAPDLLEACRQIVWKLSFNSKLPDYEGPGRIDRRDATVKMAIAAIAKAERAT